MDVLKDKAYLDYSYKSRYASFPYYYNTTDNKFVYGLTNQLNDSTPYVLVILQPSDTLDSLADKYYGRPDLYWVIADFNKIQDPFINIYNTFNSLNIPTLNAITFDKDDE